MSLRPPPGTELAHTMVLDRETNTKLELRLVEAYDCRTMLEISDGYNRVDFPADELTLKNLSEWFLKASAELTKKQKVLAVDHIQVRDQLEASLKPSTGKWKLEGLDTFEGEAYPLTGEFDSRQLAEEAAEVRLKFLEDTQPTRSSGGQEGIQDQVFIIAPDGGRYRYLPKGKKDG